VTPTEPHASPPREPAGDPALPTAEETAVSQTIVLLTAAAAIGVVVLELLKVGYPEARTPPGWFVWPTASVFVIGLATALPEHLGSIWAIVTSNPYDPKQALPHWRARRPTIQPKVVYLLSATLLLAFTALVWNTGLGIESPYVPLVSAPAVFGPFIAKRGRTVLGLAIVVGLTLGAIALWAPRSACTHESSCSARLADGRSVAVEDRYKPRKSVYVGVAVTLIVLASLIAAARLERERRVAAENAEVRERLVKLQAENAEVREKLAKLQAPQAGTEVGEPGDSYEPEEDGRARGSREDST
jgi:hypothetical protein